MVFTRFLVVLPSFHPKFLVNMSLWINIDFMLIACQGAECLQETSENEQRVLILIYSETFQSELFRDLPLYGNSLTAQ